MMLITCGGCGAKMRVPDTAAGKRVKCPKCAAKIDVPATGAAQADAANAESKKPTPPLPPAIAKELADEEMKTSVMSPSAKPPPIRPTRALEVDDDEEEDRPRRRRRRMDADEDDYLDARNQRRRNPASGQATAAMTLGIVSLTMSTLGACCCGLFGDIIAIVCGGIALTLGLTTKSQKRNSATTTGVICGSIGLGLGILLLILRITLISMNFAGGGNLFNFNGFGGQQF